MVHARIISTLAFVVALLAGCIAGDGPNSPEPADEEQPGAGFAATVQPIFTNNCAFSQCHAGSNPQAGLNLSPGVAPQNLVNVSAVQAPTLVRVAPGDPDSSYLVLKIEGKAGAVGGVSTKMPLGGSLTQAQIDTIREWIADGAKND